jgi:hypothetical protein
MYYNGHSNLIKQYNFVKNNQVVENVECENKETAHLSHIPLLSLRMKAAKNEQHNKFNMIQNDVSLR